MERKGGNLMHAGSWFGLPDFGLTEWAGSLIGAPKTSQGGSDIIPGNTAPKPAAPAPTPTSTSSVKGSTTYAGGGTTAAKTAAAPQNNTVSNAINSAQSDQQAAAARAAEAARAAAERRYNASVDAGKTAKTNAGANYDWLIGTLGSNKQDTLNQITQNENTSLEGYAKNQTDTQAKYDSSRQEILSTYRDLNTQQEKILRGSGQSQSSRSQEAQLRLNNLMGKDLSGLSIQNADAMAVIGNAIAAVKQKAGDLSTQVETQTKQQLDKSALEYKQQLDAIDQNMTLASNQKQDAYDQADAKLQADIANINSWAAGLKVQQAQTEAQLKSQLDNFITGNTSANGTLLSNLGDAQTKLNSFVDGVSNTSLTPGSQGDQQQTPVFQQTTDKSKLDQLLASGQITQEQYNQQLSQVQSNPATLLATAAPAGAAPAAPSLPNRGSITTSAQSDPLLAGIFGRATA